MYSLICTLFIFKAQLFLLDLEELRDKAKGSKDIVEEDDEDEETGVGPKVDDYAYELDEIGSEESEDEIGPSIDFKTVGESDVRV